MMKEARRDLLPSERTPLLASSAPADYSLPTQSGTTDKRTLTPRLRSNSLSVNMREQEEEAVFTSYGPVVVEDHSNSWLLGSLLAILSGILFTANNFLVKYYTIEAVDMLMVRSCLQTILTALVISKIFT